MYYHERSRITYLTPPRTASRAIRDALLSLGYKRHGGHHGMSPEVIGKSQRVLCTIRHPLDVLVSWWSRDGNLDRAELPFSEWLLGPLLNGETAIHKWWLHGLGAPYDVALVQGCFTPWMRFAREYVRYDHNIEVLSARVSAALGEDVHLEHVGDSRPKRALGSDRKHWREHYTPQALRAALKVFGDECAALGYEVE